MSKHDTTSGGSGVRPAGSDTLTRLRPLFTPDSVAIVGASGTPGKYGNTVVRYLKAAGFKGRIYPINPEGGHYEGLPFYKSLREVPERIDCAYSIVPAAAVPKVTAEAATAGVRALIIGASGFAEMATDAGRQRQDAIIASAQPAGMIILGPNTNGIWNAHHGLALGFNTSHGEPMTQGPISIAAHSGALFDSFLPRLKQFGGGFAKLVPLGNEATLDMLEVMEAFIDDAETQVIGLIMEAIRDGARFRELAARAHAARKPVIVLKLARSAAGQTAAIAHSSRLAGSMRAYDALLREAGVTVVRSIETLAAVCTLISDERALSLKGDTRLIGMSGSGGGCSLMADHAAERGIALAGDPEGRGTWTGETAKLIHGIPNIGLVRNPIDGGNLHGWEKLPAILEAMDRDNLGGPVAAFAHRLPTLAGDMGMFAPLIARKERAGAPVVVVAPGGLRAEILEHCRNARIPLFSDVGTCFDAVNALYDAAQCAAAFGLSSGEAPAPLPVAVGRKLEALLSAAPGDFLPEIESAEILRLAGIRTVDTSVVFSADEAVRAASELGGLAVMKGIVPGVAHKHDAGLVVVGISHENAIRDAFERIAARAGPLGDGTTASRIVIQRYTPGSAEIILGTTWEPGLGHFLLAGIGGIHAELFDSVLLLPVPIPIAAIARRLGETKVGQLLTKLSARQPHDFLAEIVVALDGLQRLVLTAPDTIRSIDVNPMSIGPAGTIALDALVVPRRSG